MPDLPDVGDTKGEPERVTALVCAPNFRDIGGVAAADGRRVRRGVVFRSEAILDPVDADADLLRALGIALVLDLRSGNERTHAPNLWWSGQGVEVAELDILGTVPSMRDAWGALRADPGGAGALRVMRRIYQDLPAAAAPHLATVFVRIAAGDVPLLIHCTAGKDRTGFICAMILAALGVKREDIVRDYLASVGRASARVIDHTRRMASAAGAIVTDEAMAALIGVERDFIEASFDRIAADFLSFPAYLERCAGLDAERLDAVRARLLE